MARIVLIMNGGLISRILSDSPIDAVTIDEDVENLDEDELVTIEGKQVCAQRLVAQRYDERVDRIFKDFWKEHQ